MPQMIGIKLRGRLGNQMFQYAALCSLAERLRCNVMFAANTLGRRFGIRGHWLGLDQREGSQDVQQNGVLRRAFGRGCGFYGGRLVERFEPFVRHRWFPYSFSPRRENVLGEWREVYDERFHEQTVGTWFTGWFQSERYFLADAEKVRRWFEPLPPVASKIKEQISGWPAEPREMVAIHVRRGDYCQIRDTISDSSYGWMLPLEYYRAALDRVPAEAPLALFSDDPDWVSEAFKGRECWIARGNDPVVDLLLMARCRWSVIANSTFSWWAAWLNSNPDKVVIAPEFHLGYRIKQWVPDGIQVAGWTYLSAKGSD